MNALSNVLHGIDWKSMGEDRYLFQLHIFIRVDLLI